MGSAVRKEDDPCAARGGGGGGRLIPVEMALSRGLALARAVAETETLALTASFGRVLSEAATSRIPLPPFDNSAMDGYALRTADLVGPSPWRLDVTASVAAGDPGDAPERPGGAVRVFTGAPAPAWCDAVVMQERVERDGEAIMLRARPQPGQNIRRAGEDLAQGGAILRPGAVIGAREAAALAAVGAASVPVRRQVRVTVFCTGSELKAPGEPLGPGQIWNSNRYALLAALQAPWIDVTDLGAIPDETGPLTRALVEAARSSDLIISTGGVSVGDKDHMSRVLRDAGGDVHAMRLAMKPGKPLVLGVLGAALYMGLPGNPVAAFVTWKVIGDRILRKLSGQSKLDLRAERARADFSLRRRPGRCEYRPARITGAAEDGAPLIDVLTPSFSARIATLAEADGLAILPAAAAEIGRLEPLDFLPL